MVQQDLPAQEVLQDQMAPLVPLAQRVHVGLPVPLGQPAQEVPRVELDLPELWDLLAQTELLGQQGLWELPVPLGRMD